MVIRALCEEVRSHCGHAVCSSCSSLRLLAADVLQDIACDGANHKLVAFEGSWVGQRLDTRPWQQRQGSLGKDGGMVRVTGGGHQQDLCALCLAGKLLKRLQHLQELLRILS